MTGESTCATSKERNDTTRSTYINYCLKNEVSIILHCQLCSTCYTALQIKNCSKSTSAIKAIATMKYTDDFCYERKPLPNRHLLLSAKMNWTQRRTLVKNEECLMPKGTRLAETTLNSEKIKPVALVSYTYLNASVSQSATRKFCYMYIFKIL